MNKKRITGIVITITAIIAIWTWTYYCLQNRIVEGSVEEPMKEPIGVTVKHDMPWPKFIFDERDAPIYTYSERVVRCPDWKIHSTIEYETWKIETDVISDKIKEQLERSLQDEGTTRYCNWALVFTLNHFENDDDWMMLECVMKLDDEDINCN